MINSSPMFYITVSPWPLMLSFSIFFLMMGFLKWMCLQSFYLFFLGFLMTSMCLYQWWRDVVRESTYQGFHNNLIMNITYFSFILFIISEVFFFISFFWSYFHMMLSPSIECGNCWPPVGLNLFNPFEIPLLNSFILITSGMVLTISHYSLLLDLVGLSQYYLGLTIILGLIFTMFQLLEYLSSSFTIADSVYGSLFFMMTGFHGLHVLVGTMFLIVCYYRMKNNHYLDFHYMSVELASWYWHFVDVVWLFLYIIVYWWVF